MKLWVSIEGGGNRDIKQERKFTRIHGKKEKNKAGEQGNLEQKDIYRK